MAAAEPIASSGGSAQFRGRYVNKLDGKKRVSIPASFRAALAGQGLVLRRSNRLNCIEAWPAGIFTASSSPITPADVNLEADDDSFYVNYADTVDAAPDNEGRLIMDAKLLDHAGITDAIAFLGKDQIFELWEPRAAEEMIEAARLRAQARALARRGGA